MYLVGLSGMFLYVASIVVIAICIWSIDVNVVICCNSNYLYLHDWLVLTLILAGMANVTLVHDRKGSSR